MWRTISFSKAPWKVPHEGFGYTDDMNWYCVMVIGKRKSVGPGELRRRCLQQAVAYAKGTRFDLSSAAYPVEAVGFAALELWRDALTKGEADAHQAELHASFLKWSREHPAAFLREVELSAAAAMYDAVVSSLAKLHSVCAHERDRGHFETSARWEAVRHLEAALSSERKAISALESVCASGRG